MSGGLSRRLGARTVGFWRAAWQRLRRQWMAVVGLAVIWALLWGSPAVGTVLAGLLVGLAIVVLLPLPAVPRHLALHPWAVLRLFVQFNWDLVRASFQVAWLASRPGPPPRGGIVAVPLPIRSALLITIVAELTSLVPGTVVVEVEPGVLYLHVLDLASAGGPDRVRASTLRLAEQVCAAFGGAS